MKFTIEQERNILDDYAHDPGLSWQKMCQKYEAAPGTMRSVFKRHGVKYIEDYRPFNDTHAEILTQLYQVPVLGFDVLCNTQINELHVLFIVEKSYHKIYLCRCKCGELRKISRPSLKNGQKSCGCKKNELIAQGKLGSHNPNWKGGCQFYCQRCEKKIRYGAKLCWDCLLETNALRELVPQGSNHYRWLPEEEKNTIWKTKKK